VWERVTAVVEQQRAGASATVVVDAGIVPLLHTQFGQRAVHEASVDPMRSRVRVTAPTEQLLARGLAGWAEYLVVEEPESLREELARLGRELVERNEPNEPE